MTHFAFPFAKFFFTSDEGCVTVAGSDCVFPFIYNKNIYGGCTLVDSEDGSPWCSTLVDEQGIHVEGEVTWGRCAHGSGCGQHSGLFNIFPPELAN